jgi:stage II sporulation protein D
MEPYSLYQWIFWFNLSVRSLLLLPVQKDMGASEALRIGTFYNQDIYTLEITTKSPGFFTADDIFFDYKAGDTIRMEKDTLNFVRVYRNRLVLGRYRNVLFPESQKTHSVLPNRKRSSERTYTGELHIFSFRDELRMINLVRESDYLTSVITEEAGYGQMIELYRVQSIVSRTYALVHSGRHGKRGFDFCDLQHCQVYEGVRGNESARIAVRSTENLVIVDERGRLITSAYHSNCGGRTANSEDVWVAPRSYLRSVIDSNCVFESKSEWEVTMKEEDWSKWLENVSATPVIIPADFTFINEDGRPLYTFSGISVKCSDVARHFGFRSAWFSIRDKGDILLFDIRGNGHRVGLCQQGARVMASAGYTFKEILTHYYTGIKIVSIEDLKPSALRQKDRID